MEASPPDSARPASLVIGLTVLAAALTFGELLTHRWGDSRLAAVLGRSLEIGGWVAMWHPMEIFLYEWWPLLAELRLYERLSHTPVEVVYAGTRAGQERPLPPPTHTAK